MVVACTGKRDTVSFHNLPILAYTLCWQLSTAFIQGVSKRQAFPKRQDSTRCGLCHIDLTPPER